MSDGLAIPGEVQPTYYIPDPNMTFEEWMAAVGQIAQLRKASRFWLGDAIAFGENKYGEKYAQAIDETKFDYQTLANAVWVCKSIEPSRRRENLSFAHHEAVAKLEPAEQDQWLDEAARNKWSSADLRGMLKESKGGADGDAELVEANLRNGILTILSDADGMTYENLADTIVDYLKDTLRSIKAKKVQPISGSVKGDQE